MEWVFMDSLALLSNGERPSMYKISSRVVQVVVVILFLLFRTTIIHIMNVYECNGANMFMS